MRIHIIQKGETLTAIAAQYEVKEEDIIEKNPQLAKPDYIVPGMKLTIPQPTKKIMRKQDKRPATRNQETKNKNKDRKSADKSEKVNLKPRRPVNEALHDDGRIKRDPEVGVHMFHPASRPFSSMKHKQVIHGKPDDDKKEKVSHIPRDKANPKNVEKKHIYCDCCLRPMYFE